MLWAYGSAAPSGAHDSPPPRPGYAGHRDHTPTPWIWVWQLVRASAIGTPEGSQTTENGHTMSRGRPGTICGTDREPGRIRNDAPSINQRRAPASGALRPAPLLPYLPLPLC